MLYNHCWWKREEARSSIAHSRLTDNNSTRRTRTTTNANAGCIMYCKMTPVPANTQYGKAAATADPARHSISSKRTQTHYSSASEGSAFRGFAGRWICFLHILLHSITPRVKWRKGQNRQGHSVFGHRFIV
uniref:Uncharacterized protein n=1 Tax=Anopheles atroparvus TaxID=41427 RepID=A0AAG5DIR8_ANOAO